MAKQIDKVIELFFKLHPLVVYKIRSVAKDTTGNIEFIKKLKLINIHDFTEIIAKTHTQIDKEDLVQFLEESLNILNQRLEKLSQEGHQETKSSFLEYCKNLRLTLEEFDWLIEPSKALAKHKKKSELKKEINFYGNREISDGFYSKIPDPKHSQLREQRRRFQVLH
jgi:hypothetical protein